MKPLDKSPNIVLPAQVIVFNPDGMARCLWTDTVPLQELGRLEVRRVTTIEFQNSTQVWEVRDRRGRRRFFARSRATCLAWEQRHLNP